jgi:hypothetical protein
VPSIQKVCRCTQDTIDIGDAKRHELFQDFIAARRPQTMWRSKSVRSAHAACTASRRFKRHGAASFFHLHLNVTSPPDEFKHSGVESRCISRMRNTDVKSKQSGVGRLCMVITRNTLPRGIFKPCSARHRITADSFLSWLLGESKRCGTGHQ